MHDRRVKQLSLTEKGTDLEKKLSDVQRQQMGAIFQNLVNHVRTIGTKL